MYYLEVMQATHCAAYFDQCKKSISLKSDPKCRSINFVLCKALGLILMRLVKKKKKKKRISEMTKDVKTDPN